MAAYRTEQIRNVVLLGHGSSGKTSLVEAMAFRAGVTNRLGRVEDGNTVADFDEEEIRRSISVSVAVVPCPWKDTKINVLDTPGYLEFVGEVLSGMRVAETALFVLDGAAGVEVGTELLWRQADERSLPRLVVINKMDRERLLRDLPGLAPGGIRGPLRPHPAPHRPRVFLHRSGGPAAEPGLHRHRRPRCARS